MVKKFHWADTVSIGIWIIGVLGVTCVASGQQAHNVIVIVADDAGYADFGFMTGLSGVGNTPGFNSSLTPNLDALAGRGVTFDRAYVAANCQPTRAAIITGGYQQRIGNESVGNNLFLHSQVAEFGLDGIPESTSTLWDRFKQQGYVTGAIGKWHLGSIDGINRPQDLGVDEFYGHWHGSRDYVLGRSYNLNQADNPNSGLQPRYMRETVRQSDGTVTDTIVEGTRSGQYITNVFGDYAVQFIEDHASQDPFVLYQAFTAPHKPWSDDSPDYNDPRITGLQGVRREVASMMITMDKEIGRMVARLEDPNGDGDTSDSIADTTTIVFVNDNGGVSGSDSFGNGTNNGLLDSVKGSPKEGGIRVPMLIAGAGVDQSVHGTVYNKPVHGIDILPTVLSLSGAAPIEGEDAIDGINLLPYINGQSQGDPHDVLVHRWRGTFSVIKDEGDDQWKLINTNNESAREDRYRLYNVADDIDESDNLIDVAAHAGLVAELKRDLTNHEVFFDKPRYSILANTLEQEPVNVFDHHVFNPDADEARWSGGKADGDGYFEDPAATLNWFEADTTTARHLLRADGFAGAVLEFGTHDSDYTATNDLLRRTGLEFMLNRIVLSGDYADTDHHTATIDGLSVLFTDSLVGEEAQVIVSAQQAGSGTFTYDLDLDLILYDDLAFVGEGDVTVNINGTVRDYFEARNLIKRGSSIVNLTGQATHAGDTLIEGGTLALTGGAALTQTTRVQIEAGAVLDVSGTDAGGISLNDGQTLSGAGNLVGDLTLGGGAAIEHGASPGLLTINGDTTLQTSSSVVLEIQAAGIAGTDYDQLEVTGQLIVNGGSLIVVADQSYVAAAGDTFSFLGFGSAQGEFDSLVLPGLSDGLIWDAEGLLTNGVVRVVPEPVTVAWLIVGGVACAFQRPR